MIQSGEQATYETGAVRDSDNSKSRPDLIPGCCMLRVGKRYAAGARYYGAHNFEKGIPSSRGLASLQRHLEAWKAGHDDEDHLGALVFNAMLLIFNEERFKRGGDGEAMLDHPRYENWDPELEVE